jgi:hypothetical protein
MHEYAKVYGLVLMKDNIMKQLTDCFTSFDEIALNIRNRKMNIGLSILVQQNGR